MKRLVGDESVWQVAFVCGIWFGAGQHIISKQSYADSCVKSMKWGPHFCFFVSFVSCVRRLIGVRIKYVTGCLCKTVARI